LFNYLISDIPKHVNGRKLKVLQVSRVYWPNLGGIEKIAQGLAENLVEKGHVCDVVTLNRAFEDGRDLEAYSKLNGVNIYRVPYKGSNRYPLAPTVYRFLSRYDIVHVHAVDFMADWLVATQWLHKKPIVLSTHGGFFHTDYMIRAKKLWFNTVTRFTTSRVQRVLASSEHDYELFSKIAGNVELARNAVDLSDYSQIEPAPVAGNFITVGRVDVHKGIIDLLHTLSELKKIDDRPFNMRIIGPVVADGLEQEITRCIKDLGLTKEVFLDGRLEFEQLFDAVTKSELGLFPSTYEAFGISVVEAMGAGVVPVLNDIGAFRHFVNDGHDGFITDFSDHASAAICIKRARDLSKRDRRSMVKASRLRSKEYGWTASVSRFEELYTEVIREWRGNDGQ
jgi:alpha-1,3-mannosyltransferase